MRQPLREAPRGRRAQVKSERAMLAERDRQNVRLGLVQAQHDASAFIRIPWSAEEDATLEKAVMVYGTKHWAGIGKDKCAGVCVSV